MSSPSLRFPWEDIKDNVSQKEEEGTYIHPAYSCTFILGEMQMGKGRLGQIAPVVT